MWRYGLLAGAALAVLGSPAQAVETGAPVEARRLTAPLALDGRLDEADWVAAQPLNQFWEYYPAEHAAPSEKTAVRFLYDDRYLYVGFRTELRDVRALRKPFVRRDKVNSTLDYIQVYLDPLGGRRSSYLFRVGARGTRADGYQDEAKQVEVLDPDYDWDVRTAVDSQGWSAELRIPLTTLRISRAGAQAWSVIVTRGVPRQQNTQMSSAPFPHNSSCFLCYAGTLSFADLNPKTDNLLVTPSVVGTARRDSGSFGHGDHVGDQPSLDVKWLPYAGAALDLTVKPDFSQVEADQAQLTSNARFALSVPEKRPFFREGTDLTSLPIPALYTRAIAAPVWGLRFTQRGEALNATAFAARDTGRPAIIEPGFLYSQAALPDFNSEIAFARGRYSLGAVDAGATVISKRNTDGSHNEVEGVDAVWGSSTDRITAQVLRSQTLNPDRPDLLAAWTGQKLTGAAALAQWDHTGENYIWTARYSRFDDGFRSWLGYVPRVGYEDWYGKVQNPHYLHGGPLIEVGPYVGYERIDGLGAPGREGGFFFGTDALGPHNFNADFSVHPSAEVLTEQGEERHTTYAQATVNVNPVSWIPLVSVTAQAGQMVDFATGEVTDGASVDATLRIRPIDRLELEARRAETRLGGLGAGRLKETVTGLTATWFFNARFYVLANVQLYDSDRRWPTVGRDRSSLASVQFSWEPRSDTQLFWGVRSGDAQPQGGPDGRSTEVYLKLSRTFGARI